MSKRAAWITPPDIPSEVECRTIEIPLSTEWLGIISGALLPLIYPENWEQDDALNISTDDASAKAQEIYFAFLDSVCGSGKVIGEVFFYAGVTTSPPAGALPCDGTTYNRVDYPALYAILEGVFKINADTFKTPDLRGRTLTGVGTHTGGAINHVVGVVGGAEKHQLVTTELAAHVHWQRTLIASTGAFSGTVQGIDNTAGNPQDTISTQPTGSDVPHNNMQPYIPLRPYIQAL